MSSLGRHVRSAWLLTKSSYAYEGWWWRLFLPSGILGAALRPRSCERDEWQNSSTCLWIRSPPKIGAAYDHDHVELGHWYSIAQMRLASRPDLGSTGVPLSVRPSNRYSLYACLIGSPSRFHQNPDFHAAHMTNVELMS